MIGAWGGGTHLYPIGRGRGNHESGPRRGPRFRHGQSFRNSRNERNAGPLEGSRRAGYHKPEVEDQGSLECPTRWPDASGPDPELARRVTPEGPRIAGGHVLTAPGSLPRMALPRPSSRLPSSRSG